jgi:hypothetical protein
VHRPGRMRGEIEKARLAKKAPFSDGRFRGTAAPEVGEGGQSRKV